MTLSQRLVTGFILWSLAGSALACSCIDKTPWDKFADAKEAFIGTAVRYIKSSRGESWTVVRFNVTEPWKGVAQQSIDIEVPTSDGLCGIEILIGKSYVVYADAETDGSLVATLCDGTRGVDEAREDIAWFRSLERSSPREIPFSDVPASHPYAQAIDALRDDEVISGYGDGTFRPERNVTRAEIVKILAQAILPYDYIEREKSEYAFTDTALPFTDLDARAWYNLYLRRAYRGGLIQGYKDGTFKPAQSVTVAEASKLVIQALELESPHESPLWYEKFIRAVADRRAMPVSIRTVDAPISRGELAEMIWRLEQHVEDRPSMTGDDLLSPQCVKSEDSEIPNIDLRRVRQAWLDLYNAERERRDLPRYTFNPYLSRSAAIWSNVAARRGRIDHVREGTQGAYNYAAIQNWFKDLGLEFRNVGGITFTENIGRGPYSCKSGDCTERLIDAMSETFKFYMNEQDASYRPHFNAIVSDKFTMIGVGIAVKDGQYYVTTHFATDIVSSPPRLCSVDGN